GGLTSGIGGLLKIGGGVASMLGTTAGKGLIGRIGLMGATAGPVGLAVVTVGLLAVGLYKLSEAHEESTSRARDSIVARREELDSLDEIIARYEDLQRENRLSTDEVLRYMDIMSELKDAKSEEAIAKLTEEQNKLLEKSGLTNEEMVEFSTLNGQIVEKSPETVSAISEQGNAYAENLEKLKELNQFERQRLTIETWDTITKEMDKQTENLDKQASLAKDIYQAGIDQEEINKNIIESNGIITDAKLEIARLEKEGTTATEERKIAIMNELSILDEIVADEMRRTDELEEQEKNLKKKLEKNRENLAETKKELDAFRELTDEYAQMVLFEQGFNSEKGKSYEAILKEQAGIDKSRQKLEEKNKTQKLGPGIYEEELAKISEQQGKLDVVKQKLAEANELAGKKIYKGVEVTVSPSIESLNRNLGAPVSKTINVKAAGEASRLSSYAVGTDYHPGGLALVGEEGPELARLGNRWDMLGFGVKDLPRGTQVFTHDETKDILKSMNRLPQYASGISPHGEADRVVSQLNNQQQPQQPIVIKPAPVYLDDYLIGEIMFEAMDGRFASSAEMTLYMKGMKG